MDPPPLQKAPTIYLPRGFDAEGFVLDIRVYLRGDEELRNVAEQYSTASCHTIHSLLSFMDRSEIEWN